MTAMRAQLRLLGPVEIETGDGLIALGGTKERVLLAYLAVRANAVVSEDALVDALWPDDPPRTAKRTLQAYLSRVRKSLTEADPTGASLSLSSQPGGWVLHAAPGALDVTGVETLLREANAATAAGDHLGAALALAEALRAWRGRPLGDVGDAPWAMAATARLEELRLHVIEERFDAELACGRHGALVGEIEALCATHPLRERLWGLLMTALYRSGRQAEALRTYQRLRATLADELGISPSPALAELEQRILQQDRRLERDAMVPTHGVTTLLCADVSTADELSVVREIVAESAGTEVPSSDGFTAAFASAVSALTAAVRMQIAVARQQRQRHREQSELRIGIHAGELTSGHHDPVMALATALRDRAETRQILVSALVTQIVGSRSAFRFGPLDAGACEVEWLAEAPLPLRPALAVDDNQLAFVGRNEELAQLESAYRATVDGQGQALLIAGEPGIGKTALAAQLARRAHDDGALVLFGRCDENPLLPFQPFVEALGYWVDMTSDADLERRLGRAATDLALLVPQLRKRIPDLPPASGSESERYRLFDAVPTALAAIAADAPAVVLVLDDLHWADRPTLQLLHHTIRRRGATPLLIVGTYRDTELVRGHPLAEVLVDLRRAQLVERLPLRGLAAEEVVGLVVPSLEAAPADLTLAGALWRETEGSPLFLREIVRHLAETDALVQTPDGRWRTTRRIEQLGIPEGVKEVIGRRLSRLSEPANAVLRAGSVVGREFAVELIERLTDLSFDGMIDALDEATRAGIIAEVVDRAGRYTFTHALVRDVLYGELSLTRRVVWHRRVGEAIEAIHGRDLQPHLAELAHHFGQAAVAGQSDKAIEYCRAAGDADLGNVAYEEAVRQFATGLEIAAETGAAPAVRSELQLRLGEAQLRGGDVAARSTFASAAALARAERDVETLAHAALGYAGAGIRVLWMEIGVAVDDVISLLEEALTMLDERDSDLRALLLSTLARELYWLPGTTERRRALSAAATDMARRGGSSVTLAHVLANRCLAVFGPDAVDERIANGREIAAIAESLGDATLTVFGEGHRLVALLERGEIADAMAKVDDLIPLVERLKEPVLWSVVWSGSALRAEIRGAFDEAMRLRVEAYQRSQQARDRNSVILFLVATITTLRRQGRSAELIGPIRAAAGLYPLVGDAVRSNLAVVHADEGNADAVRTELDRLHPADPGFRCGDVAWLYALCLMAECATLLDDRERAAELYQLLLPYEQSFVTVGYLVAYGPVAGHLGLLATTLGRHDDAVRHARVAVAAVTNVDAPVLLAEAQVILALALAARNGGGDRSESCELATQARAAAEALGMVALVGRADEVLARATGAPIPERTGTTVPVSLRERGRSRLTGRARSIIRRLARDLDDAGLVRRFGTPLAQRTLFTAMARSFQPSQAFGFEGDILFEVRLPTLAAEPLPPDCWTVEVKGHKATARRDRVVAPAVAVAADLPDLVRVLGGDLHPMRAVIEGRIEIEGNLIVASRLTDMFGGL